MAHRLVDFLPFDELAADAAEPHPCGALPRRAPLPRLERVAYAEAVSILAADQRRHAEALDRAALDRLTAAVAQRSLTGAPLVDAVALACLALRVERAHADAVLTMAENSRALRAASALWSAMVARGEIVLGMAVIQ